MCDLRLAKRGRYIGQRPSGSGGARVLRSRGDRGTLVLPRSFAIIEWVQNFVIFTLRFKLAGTRTFSKALSPAGAANRALLPKLFPQRFMDTSGQRSCIQNLYLYSLNSYPLLRFSGMTNSELRQQGRGLNSFTGQAVFSSVTKAWFAVFVG